jgi:hypothetical protein
MELEIRNCCRSRREVFGSNAFTGSAGYQNGQMAPPFL